ncbi:hypothetical protein [Acinetobacter sp. MB5]|uniref:hypothetical protein n=1 Tax=Acinetobacter sp. MB5 TaxID=2069438 RepID=UPI000DD04AC1|nr:hypothetical protein [Acinetobacter sp. MB5]
MISMKMNKLIFINNAAKHSQEIMTYCFTTLALMLTLAFEGVITGNLKPEYFIYALVVSLAFALWAVIDHKFRKE